MTPDEAYKDLMERLRYPDSARLRAVMEYLMDEEQVLMVASLPGTVQEVADKLGMDVEKVQKGLDDCFFRGIVVPKGDYITRVIERRIIESDIRFKIDEIFRASDIVIAFPQRDIHLDTQQPLELRLLDADHPAKPSSGQAPP